MLMLVTTIIIRIGTDVITNKWFLDMKIIKKNIMIEGLVTTNVIFTGGGSSYAVI